MSSWVCYHLLREDSGATYIGATNDLSHRIRQHNCEIKGGAKYTSSAVKNGHTWTLVCTVGRFPDMQTALQFEWMWKHITRKSHTKLPPNMRRIRAVIDLVNAEKSTSKSRLYTDFEPLKIIVYNINPNTETLFNTEIKHATAVLCDVGNPDADHRICAIGGALCSTATCASDTTPPA
jgi:predicted GIY-YIG superfamily endonuclease